MSKKNEINYLKKIGKKAVEHSVKRPFSDGTCGGLLSDIGAIMSLMPDPPARVLDLGCGAGWTSKFLSLRGYEVTGSDISPDMIEIAKKYKGQNDNLKFIAEDYENLDFNEEFDSVIFYDALHHAEDEQKAIKCAYKSLKKGGVLITSEPGKGHEKREIAIRAVEKYGVNEKSMSPKYIINLGRKAGFKKFKIYPKANFIHFALYTKNNTLPLNDFWKKLFKLNMVKFLAVLWLITFYKKRSGIVIMIK